MSENITRCPKCATSFRISQAHLSSAKGSVRCGSCLTIFNAKENLVSKAELEDQYQVPETEQNQDEHYYSDSQGYFEQQQPAIKKAGTPKTSTPPPTKTKTKEVKKVEVNEDDDLLISDDMLPDDEDRRGGLIDEFGTNVLEKSSNVGTQEFNLFERDVFQEEEDEEEVKPDESWAEELLEDDEDEPVVVDKELKSEEAEQEQEFSQSYSNSPFQIIETPSDDELAQQSSWRQDNSELEVGPALGNTDVDIDEIIDEFAYQNKVHESASNTRFLHSIEPEPVEFAFKKSYPFWYSTRLWTVLALVAAAALFVQLSAQRFESLSRIEPYRSYYSAICPYLGCQLPTLVDRSMIKATNLVVRSHPKLKQALMVDAVLQNNADFPQTFPSLDLVFTDLQGKPLAARRFTPEEYLGGEVAGRTNIPVKQPIHISLELVDPGPDAVSYFITIAE